MDADFLLALQLQADELVVLEPAQDLPSKQQIESSAAPPLALTAVNVTNLTRKDVINGKEWVLPPETRRRGFTNLCSDEAELLDPNPDIRELFMEFNEIYFHGFLDACEVRWSPRMTLCAGVCSWEGRGGLCSIRLSKPLLSLRPRSDLVNTLLHEMIHAWEFLYRYHRNRESHGPEFLRIAEEINNIAGTNITVYHTFHDEVDSYRTHWWRCTGVCRTQQPFFGFVRRAMNRAPGPSDWWWKKHRISCSGTFVKIKEPSSKKKLGKGKGKTDITPNSRGFPTDRATVTGDSKIQALLVPSGKARLTISIERPDAKMKASGLDQYKGPPQQELGGYFKSAPSGGKVEPIEATNSKQMVKIIPYFKNEAHSTNSGGLPSDEKSVVDRELLRKRRIIHFDRTGGTEPKQGPFAASNPVISPPESHSSLVTSGACIDLVNDTQIFATSKYSNSESVLSLLDDYIPTRPQSSDDSDTEDLFEGQDIGWDDALSECSSVIVLEGKEYGLDEYNFADYNDSPISNQMERTDDFIGLNGPNVVITECCSHASSMVPCARNRKLPLESRCDDKNSTDKIEVTVEVLEVD